MNAAPAPTPSSDLRERAKRLGLHAVLAHWEEYHGAEWLPTLVEREETLRQRRSLERRLRGARIGRFAPMADYDYEWPAVIDRDLVDELFTLDFLREKANVIIIGTSGLGKTMIAQNLAYQALLEGHTVRFTSASEMLSDLAAQESAAGLARRLRRYCSPTLLAIDEVGYLNYGARHADLLFEVVARRHEQKSTIITTNRIFQEWNEVFPHATCIVALVDRLVHAAEILRIEGGSYRKKQAEEREARKAQARANRRRGRKARP